MERLEPARCRADAEDAVGPDRPGEALGLDGTEVEAVRAANPLAAREGLDGVTQAAIAGLPPRRHSAQDRHRLVDIVVDDHLALTMVLTVEPADILRERSFQEVGIVRNRVSRRGSSKPSPK